MLRQAHKKSHSFEKSLKVCDTSSNILDEFYKRKFGATTVDTITDLFKQKKGIDKEVFTKLGDIIKIEEKIRKNSYSDVLLEINSSVEAGTPGRTVDQNKVSDFIAYYIEPRKILYLIDYKQLRRAMIQNLDKWKDSYPIHDAHNDGYTTRNIAVPLHIIEKAGVNCTINNLTIKAYSNL